MSGPLFTLRKQAVVPAGSAASASQRSPDFVRVAGDWIHLRAPVMPESVVEARTALSNSFIESKDAWSFSSSNNRKPALWRNSEATACSYYPDSDLRHLGPKNAAKKILAKGES